MFKYYDPTKISAKLEKIADIVDQLNRNEIEILECYKIYAPMINEDLNEGRGRNVFLLYPSVIKEVAEKLGRKKNVQGTDAWIKPVPLLKVKTSFGIFWLTINTIEFPDAELIEKARKRKKKEEILEKVKDKLTDEELKLLLD